MPNLFIDIEARFAKFQDSLDRIGKDSADFVNGLNRSFSLLRNIGIGFGAGIGLDQIANAFKNTVDAADTLNGVSEKTGIVVSSLSELKFAAEQSNVSFDELEAGLKAFAKSIDASDKAFSRIGLNAKEFKTLESALDAVADRFIKIQNPIEASSLAMELFGKGGAALVPLLQKGAGGIAQFREEARKLNIVLSDDFAKAADEYNDNIAKIGEAWQALKNRIANSILPFLGGAAEQLVAALKVEGSLPGALARGAITSPGFDPAEKIRKTEADVKDLEQRIAKIGGGVGGGEFDFFSGSAEEVDRLNKKLDETRKKLEYLRALRDIQLRDDPALKALAEKGIGVRENSNIQNAGSITVGDKTNDDSGNRLSSGQSDFESLKRSLTSELQTELKLTKELILVEDKRFKALDPAQQGELLSIAKRIDALKLEKDQQIQIRQTIEVEQSLREISEREELDSIESRKSAIQRDYQDRKLSAQEYYSFLAAEETRANELQISNLRIQEEIASSRAKDTALPAQDRDSALVQQAEVRQRINALILEQTDIEQRNARAAAQADEETLDRKVRIAQQLNELRGTPDIELDRLALERKFKDLPKDVKASITFQTFLDTTIAEQQLATFERKAGTIQQTLQVTEERNQLDFESGTSNRQEFRSRTVSARRKAIDELSQLVTKIQELKKANEGSFGPEQEVRLVTLKTRLEELRSSADEYLNTAKEIGSGPTTEFFEDIITGSKDAKSAFDDLVKSIQANLARLLAEDITNQLFGALRKGTESFGGIDGILSSLGIGGQRQQQKQGAVTGVQGVASVAAGSGITLESVGAFLGFGNQQKATQLTQPSSAIGLSADIASRSFGAGSAQQGEGADAIPAFTESLSEGAATLLQFNSSTEQADSSVENFTSSFSVVDVGAQLFSLLTSSTQAVVGTEALASATTTAAAQIAVAGATASASSFSADGNIFSGGYQVAFAKGGAFEDGDVMPFAVGGIVAKPTTFPIRGGKTGLMGEAGPEAIMPLSSIGGQFSVYAIGEDGKETTLPLTRGASGKLSVQLSGMSSTSTASGAFASGGVFNSGIESTSFAFADGAVFTSTKHMPVRFYSGGGIANSPQMAVYGEGARPEAFVPLPDGRTIPVTLDDASQGITVIQNITTPDANSFRRSRSALFNDVQAGLSTAASKS